MDNLLICPKCGSSLIRIHNSFICKNKYIWRIKDNIPIFTEREYYYEDLPKDRLLDIISKTKEHGLEFLKQNLFKDNKYLKFLAFSERRADWKHLTHINRDSIVLDLGCGFGANAISLAKNAKHVFAIDATYERVKVLDLIKEEQGINNITPICANLLSLPLKSNSFDIISMIGVLEWVPQFTRSKDDPRSLQINTLKIVNRLLKHNGSVVIGIENRIGYKYFYGHPDEHVGLRFTTILPRKVANIISKFKRGKRYCTYTYSMLGYRNLLSKSGFEKVDFYIPLPFYHDPREILPASNKKILKDYLSKEIRSSNSFIRKLGKIIEISPFFSHSYLIIGKKGVGIAKNYIEKVSENLLFNDFSKNYRKVGGVGPSVVFILYNKDEATHVLKIPRSRHAEKFIKREFFTLKVLNFRGIRPIPHHPQLIKMENLNVLITEFLNGLELSKLIKKKGSLSDINRHLINRLIGSLSDIHLQFLSSQWLHIKQLENYIISSSFNQQLKKRVLEFYNQIPNNISFPVSLTHFDLSVDNILINQKTKNYFIIDWERANEGIPIHDIFNFMLTSAICKNETNKDYIIASIKRSFFENENLMKYYVDLQNQYFGNTGWGAEMMKHYFPLGIIVKDTLDKNFDIDRSYIWKEVLTLFLNNFNGFLKVN